MFPGQSFAEGGLFASQGEKALRWLHRLWKDDEEFMKSRKKMSIPYMEANFLGHSAEFKVKICDFQSGV